MATRLRKTRRLRGGRHMGWGQVGQHRGSGHQGGLGRTGMMKHHRSSLLKYEPDHYGHSSTRPPHPVVTRKWASLRDLADLYARFGTEEGGTRTVDLAAAGYDKLLGGGRPGGAYAVKVGRSTAQARARLEEAGGQVVAADG